MSEEQRVVLVGPRGAGKTTVGALIAHRMGRLLVDTDRLVEEEARQSVTEVFSKLGEEAFRIKEAEVIARLQDHGGLVIATGGGAPLLESNRESLARGSFVVFLDVDAVTAAARLDGDDVERPRLTGLEPLEEIRTVVAERRPVYSGFADLVVDASRELEVVVEELAVELRKRGFVVKD